MIAPSGRTGKRTRACSMPRINEEETVAIFLPNKAMIQRHQSIVNSIFWHSMLFYSGSVGSSPLLLCNEDDWHRSRPGGCLSSSTIPGGLAIYFVFSHCLSLILLPYGV